MNYASVLLLNSNKRTGGGGGGRGGRGGEGGFRSDTVNRLVFTFLKFLSCKIKVAKLTLLHHCLLVTVENFYKFTPFHFL